MRIRLRDLMEEDDGWGHEQGQEVHQRLLAEVRKHPAEPDFQVSLEGVRRTDSSFPRESVMEAARRFRGHRGFCLADVVDNDLLDNWDAAASRVEQPLVLWTGEAWRILGPQPSEGTRAALEYALSQPSVTASEVASHLGLQVPNVSNKLKALFASGYLLRSERPAPTGGIEHVYRRIK